MERGLAEILNGTEVGYALNPNSRSVKGYANNGPVSGSAAVSPDRWSVNGKIKFDNAGELEAGYNNNLSQDSVTKYIKGLIGNSDNNIQAKYTVNENPYDTVTTTRVDGNVQATDKLDLSGFYEQSGGNNWSSDQKGLAASYALGNNWSATGNVTNRNGSNSWNIGLNGRF